MSDSTRPPLHRRLLCSLATASLVPALLGLCAAAPAQTSIPKVQEDFALADDRAAAVAGLLPGTAEAWRYGALLALHEGRFADFDGLAARWAEVEPQSALREALIRRRELLGYSADPSRAYQYLRDTLRPDFTHRSPLERESDPRPSELAPEEVNEAAFLARRAKGTAVWDTWTAAGLRRMDATGMSAAERRAYLNWLKTPDVPQLTELVLADLSAAPAVLFGQVGVHRLLLLEQLEELSRRMPDLLRFGEFVDLYVQRLADGADRGMDWDWERQNRHIRRLEQLVARLGPTFDSLRAHVLHHRLRLDWERGAVDRGVLLAYLRLPRPAVYLRREIWEGRAASAGLVRMDQSFPTGLAPVGDDSAWVRQWLLSVLAGEARGGEWETVLEPAYLERALAEANLLAGLRTEVDWYGRVQDPAFFDALNRRVELRFGPSLAHTFASDEPVRLPLLAKNTGPILARVYALDALDAYRSGRAEIGLDLDLDGLEPHHTVRVEPATSPLLRQRITLELPQVDAPGTYLVELSGGGVASRALFHKGDLAFTQRIGAAGHVLRIYDERGQHLKDATAWLGNREFAPTEAGEILIPFALEPGSKPLILRHKNRARRVDFYHRMEAYTLRVGAHLEREMVVPGERALVLLRPQLLVHGQRAALDLLEDLSVRLLARLEDGSTAAHQIPGVSFAYGEETIVPFEVPTGLSQLTLEVSAKVPALSTGDSVELSVGPTILYERGSPPPDRLAGAHLLRDGTRAWIELRGRDGELEPGRDVQLEVFHPLFTQPHTVPMRTNSEGRLVLGAVGHLQRVRISGEGLVPRSFELWPEPARWPDAVHAESGQEVALPLPVGVPLETRDVSALEVRGGAFTSSSLGHARVEPGRLVLWGLTPGDHTVSVPMLGLSTTVKVSFGRPQQGWILGERRWLQASQTLPVGIRRVARDGDDLLVAVTQTDPAVRLHMYARHFGGGQGGGLGLDLPPLGGPVELFLAPLTTQVAEERELSGEQRYILERRQAPRFAGSLLERAGLLLNPFSLETTVADELFEGAGGAATRAGGRSRRAGAPGAGAWDREGEGDGAAEVNFLPRGAKLVGNLLPNRDGVVRVPLSTLVDEKSRTQILVVAVGADSVARAEWALAPETLSPRDLTLQAALPPDESFREVREVLILREGAKRPPPEAGAATSRELSSLAEVFQLFETLRPDSEIGRFRFLLDWHEYGREQKLEKYSEFAAHELHVFLALRDPEFFEEVVRPHLTQKVERTFLDQWLLQEDVAAWLAPQRFHRLNLAEQALLLHRTGGDLSGWAEERARDLERQPDDPALLRRLFDLAISAGALAPPAPERTQDFFLGAPASGAAPVRSGEAEEMLDFDPPTPSENEIGLDDAQSEMARKLAALGYNGGESVLADKAMRGQVRGFAPGLGETRRWVETHFWKRQLSAGSPPTVGRAFWRDFALADANEPFVSEHVLSAHGSSGEMLLALSVLGLAPKAVGPAFERGPDGELVASRPLLWFRRSIAPAPREGETPAVLVGARVFPWSAAEDPNAAPARAFAVDLPYRMEVTITNPTPVMRTVDLLVQVPEGAIAIDGAPQTRGRRLTLAPFESARASANYYFPRPGSFGHNPAQVHEAGHTVARAEPTQVEVSAKAPPEDPGSFANLAARGSGEALLEHIRTEDLAGADFGAMAWRMADREFFRAATDALRARFLTPPVLWAYGLLHQDERTTREYLQLQSDFSRPLLPYLRSPLLSLEPFSDVGMQIAEFSPLRNSRAHPDRQTRQVQDQGAGARYKQLLGLWELKPELEPLDRLELAYHLLLQERIEEALAQLERVQKGSVPSAMQRDYLVAYAALLRSDAKSARELASAYENYPVGRWRGLWRDLIQVADLALGSENPPSEVGGEGQRDPVLELELRGSTAHLRHGALERVELNFYGVELESQFSRDPFGSGGGTGTGHLLAHGRLEVDARGKSESQVPLPPEWVDRPVVVEARGGGLVRRTIHQPSTLAVDLREQEGVLVVRDNGNGRPLGAVYVKVYARLKGGEVKFYRDGYTDVLGRFDYALVSGGPAEVERFAILVLEDARGGTVRQALPPPR